MKLTKGMKKALSLLLSAAMVVTGVNVTAGKASAEETTATPSKYVLEITTPKEGDGHNKDTNENLVTKLNGEVVDFYGHDGDDMTVDGVNHSSRTFFPMEIANKIAAFKNPVYKVTSLTDGATLKLWDFCWEGMWTIGDQTGNINNSYIKDGEFLGTQKRNTVVIDYKLGETEIGIDLSGEYEDGETPEPPAWNGDTFLGFGLDFGASATIEIYDAAPAEVPTEKPAATATAPAKTTTPAQITTKQTITTPAAVGTSKIKAAQKTVVVAPGKTVKVGFTATAAKPATKAAVVTATTASKKVATAKVKGKKVVIKAPKKAVKGASTTVTLKSTNGDKKVSAKIKVYVRNSAKKVKAAKKAITVKKGKTTKLVIKASKVQNKKKAFADTITVKGKIVKLTDVKFAKGKATLTLKGAKKAKKKAVTIKVGSKSVKVKATVK